MGAFVLIKRLKDNAHFNSNLECVQKENSAQGFDRPKIFKTETYYLYLYRKLTAPNSNYIELENNDFCAFTGTLIYKSTKDEEALRLLYNDFKSAQFDPGTIYGSFCLIIKKGGQTYLFTDRLGVYKVYLDNNHTIWSTSFLTTLSIQQKTTIDTQCVYEYVFQGTTYGNKTIIKSIEITDCNFIHAINAQENSIKLPKPFTHEIVNENKKTHLERNLNNLNNYYKEIVQCFGDNIDSALSGGYDSRLTLALLQNQGVLPKLHVYGNAENDDVLIAKNISQHENFPLIHTDKSKYKNNSPSIFATNLEENYYTFDGYPVDGIFRDSTDLSTRKERCKNNQLMLNGGGGEIFRNFFYLRDGQFTIRNLLWVFYSRFDPQYCTKLFSEELYYSELEKKIRTVLDIDRNTLYRSEIELLYPIFRCRYWMGKNNSINNRFGHALTPFIDYRIVKDAISIPLSFKNYGRFEAEMISTLNPRLASYMSSYGHNFLEPPPAKRIVKDLLTYWRPSLLRKHAYRIKTRVNSKITSHYLQSEYYAPIIGEQFTYMRNFFNIEKMADNEQFNRICTLEYLFQKYKPEIE